MNVVKIIEAKRNGAELDDQSIDELIQGYARREVEDGQMAAFAMAVYFQSMTPRETAALTRSMLQSGVQLEWNGGPPKVDKHSTGGIGDKISIPLTPILACCDLAIPMISGRSLGNTGGTIDKLESISGYRTNLDLGQIRRQVAEIGCVITGASPEIAPADKRLYALRDVTATVPSIPLITASILSKKLAAGLDALVLDVKWGNGAFMRTLDEARALAHSLVSTARQMGVRTHAFVTDMNRPLGKMIGNAVEIDESWDVLQGQGPADVVELTERLAAELLQMTGRAGSFDEALQQIRRAVASGAAADKFLEMVAAQGGDFSQPRPRAPVAELRAHQTGVLSRIDTDRLGFAVVQMGGGRKRQDQALDHSVGIEMVVELGQPVARGDLLARMFCHPAEQNECSSLIYEALEISEQPAERGPLIVELIQ